jgi:2-desacetyl-2-hydroxyethyl bacteriochlorophyllide A dehydrogenase
VTRPSFGEERPFDNRASARNAAPTSNEAKPLVIVGLVTGTQQVTLREFPEPEPAPGRAVVEIAHCGICGTDLEAWRHGSAYPPAICGHEWSGVVTKLPSDVDGLAEGDRVAIGIARACRICAPCRAGQPEHCQPAFLGMLGMGPMAAPHGGFAPAIAIEAARLVPLRPALSLETGAMLEPSAVALHAVHRSGSIAGAGVVVLGAGPIGLLVLQCAKALGAGEVLVVEPQPARRALAQKLGARVIDPGQADVAASVRHRFAPLGPDIVFECAGAPDTLAQASSLVRRGGTVSLVALAGAPVAIEPGAWLGQELRLVASLGYVRDEFDEIQDLMVDGQVTPEALVSARAPLSDLASAFERLDREPDAVKILIRPEESS